MSPLNFWLKPIALILLRLPSGQWNFRTALFMSLCKDPSSDAVRQLSNSSKSLLILQFSAGPLQRRREVGLVNLLWRSTAAVGTLGMCWVGSHGGLVSGPLQRSSCRVIELGSANQLNLRKFSSISCFASDFGLKLFHFNRVFQSLCSKF